MANVPRPAHRVDRGEAEMRFRKVLVTVAVAAIASFGVAVASPAQAKPTADWEIAIDCTGPVVLPGAPGDVYMFYLTGDCLNDYVELWNTKIADPDELGFLGDNIGGSFDTFDPCDNFCAPEFIPSDWYVQNYSSYAETFAALVGSNADGGTLTPGAVVATFSDFTKGEHWYITWGQTSAGPTEYWTQGYGRASADATCDAGWAPSWDYWPNDGKGGWVCVREVPKYS
jgi:hypothetical protein